jgi:CheY-like chemotaxis protein/anti-sigma regulatory factor (Ser/Thr protein kinase)
LDVRQIDLSSVITDAIDVVRPAADAKHIQIASHFDESLGPVSGDHARLQQVVWNLLFNAVKFTPEGGRVEVRLERDGSRARVVVSDTGRGISPDFLPHVFDRFRQADGATTRSYGGLGLGLAIVRHLIEAHGGTVRVESHGEGLGATFSITLPFLAVRIEAPEIERRSRRHENGAPRYALPRQLDGVRVLVVDDDLEARQMISTVLAQSGAEVRVCISSSDALDTLSRWKPDVLMSDIGMPNEDGYALIQRVRRLKEECGGRIPAAALTAYAREEDRERALSSGFQIHVAKPVEAAELVSVVSNLIGARK